MKGSDVSEIVTFIIDIIFFTNYNLRASNEYMWSHHLKIPIN